MKDYYKILGISRGASEGEIKRAFYHLAQKYHPDKGGDQEKFKEINEAYQILSDKEKRSQYDKFGTTFEGQGAETYSRGPFEKGFGFDFGGFEDFSASSVEDIFEDFFGFSSERGTRKKRGRDITIDIDISLEEAFSGIKKEIELQKWVVCDRCKGSGGEPGTKIKTCPSCRGTGKVEQVHQIFLGTFTRRTVCPQCGGEGELPEEKCIRCGGSGRVRKIETISFFVPAGISNQEIIKVQGQGEAGERGKARGDLYVRIRIEPHTRFKRRGDDIYFDFDVKFSDAALGAVVDVPTLAGEVELNIPAGTQSGKLLRLRGMGMPHIGGRGKGDMYVKVDVKTPKRLTRQQKEIIEKLKKEGI